MNDPGWSWIVVYDWDGIERVDRKAKVFDSHEDARAFYYEAKRHGQYTNVEMIHAEHVR